MSPTAEPIAMSGKSRVLGGITVIDSPLISRALEYARGLSEPYLFNHAVRSWLFAVRLGQLQGISHDPEVVAVRTLLHDPGLTSSFTGPKRFEIEGADAARVFAREQGLDDHRARLIAVSIDAQRSRCAAFANSVICARSCANDCTTRTPWMFSSTTVAISAMRACTTHDKGNTFWRSRRPDQ